jgi:stage III sporulation protein AH
MNKKQAGIIVTLLALIVCAGILAARVNGPLQVNDGFNDGSSVFNWGKTDNSKNTDTFLSVKSQRDVDDAATLSAYNAILDKKDLSDEEKTQTMAQLTLKTKQMAFSRWQ